jgi:radical SAM protein with 4Fe4S-binding SPASM domain
LADVWAGCFRRGRPIVVEPLHTKILTHLYGGLPCPARCSLDGEAVAVAPSGRLYPCAQMIAEDRGDTLVIGTVDAGLDRSKLAELRQQKDRIETSCATCALASRCQSHCGCRHWALTGELGRINATLCELEESFIAAADRAAATLMAEGCASFVATYYRQRYTRSIGSTVTRVERPGRR